MKKIIISAFFILGAFTNKSFACEEDISQKMHLLEDSKKDVIKNLKLIEDASASNHLDYCDVGYTFLSLLENIGPSHTRSVQKIFSDLVAMANYEDTRVNEYLNSTIEIQRLENRTRDLRINISIIKDRVLKGHVSAIYGFRIFIRELRYSGYSTYKARKMFHIYVERNRNDH